MKKFLIATAVVLLGAGVFFGNQVAFAKGMATDTIAEGIYIDEVDMSGMTISEAIEEMELLGHSFYVFLEAKTNAIKVLYLRDDKDLGIIEPEI